MRFLRNPFRGPYKWSRKWIIWSVFIIPFGIYANLTTPENIGLDLKGRFFIVLEIPLIFIVFPWVLMRLSRAVRGKSPQGKPYGADGQPIEGEILELRSGRINAKKVQAKLINGTIEFPTGSIDLSHVKTFKAGDPRVIWKKLPVQLISLAGMVSYLYFIAQPLILFIEFTAKPFIYRQLNAPELINKNETFETLRQNSVLAFFIHSDALLAPMIKVLGIFIFMLIFRIVVEKPALIVGLFDGSRMIMPFNYSINGFSIILENSRIKRFKKKVKQAIRVRNKTYI